MTMRRTVSYAAIVAVAAVFSLELHQWGEMRRRDALEAYRHGQDVDARRVAAAIETSIDRVYQGIRMIAQLPSLRAITNAGGGIDGDGRFVVAYAFANYLEPTSVARVYLATLRADAAASAAATDVAAVRTLSADGSQMPGLRGGDAPEPQTTGSAEPELASIGEQIVALRRARPTLAPASPFDLPMVTGREIVLGGGAASAKTGQEREGRGSIFTVPIYGVDGRLAGAVAAVVRTSVLRRTLPAADFALVDVAHRHVVAAPGDPMVERHSARVAAIEPVPDVPFSAVYPLRTADAAGWKLWVTRPESDFYFGPDFVGAELAEIFGQLMIWCSAAGAIAIWHAHRRRVGRMNRDAEYLAQRIATLMQVRGVGRP